jgi:hypothetical protein
LEFLVFTLQLILDLGHLCREKSRFWVSRFRV